jgi:hypothetical protein
LNLRRAGGKRQYRQQSNEIAVAEDPLLHSDSAILGKQRSETVSALHTTSPGGDITPRSGRMGDL